MISRINLLGPSVSRLREVGGRPDGPDPSGGVGAGGTGPVYPSNPGREGSPGDQEIDVIEVLPTRCRYLPTCPPTYLSHRPLTSPTCHPSVSHLPAYLSVCPVPRLGCHPFSSRTVHCVGPKVGVVTVRGRYTGTPSVIGPTRGHRSRVDIFPSLLPGESVPMTLLESYLFLDTHAHDRRTVTAITHPSLSTFPSDGPLGHLRYHPSVRVPSECTSNHRVPHPSATRCVGIFPVTRVQEGSPRSR